MTEFTYYKGGTAGSVLTIKDFDMPQLERKRRIWIYLPKNYDASDLSYPVLYMHDGQNLFAPETSYCGEWRVDDTLEEQAREKDDRGIVVVGIESGIHRNQELVPGEADCDKYLDFIVHTLKPYVEAKFRVRSAREYTGICGSSFGGQTSIYAALRHNDIFGLVGAFSPSLYVDAHKVRAYVKTHDCKFYICAGQKEAANCVEAIATRFTPNVCEVADALKEIGFEVKLCIDDDGEHNEAYWSRKFVDSYEYLFKTSW